MHSSIPSSALQGDNYVSSKVEIGNQVCQTARNLVIAAAVFKKLVEVTSDKGTRILTAGTTLGLGLANIYSGNLIVGTSQTMIGTKEMVNIFGGEGIDNSRLKDLISDAQSNVKMIQTLEEANVKSLDMIGGNLTIISQNTEELHNRLKNIRSLTVEGSQILEVQKQKTCKLYAEAEQLFTAANKIFTESRQQVRQSDVELSEAIGHFDNVINIAQQKVTDTNAQELMSSFLEGSKSALNRCTKAKQSLGSSGDLLESGLELLKQAMTRNSEATFEAGRTQELAKHELEKISHQAQTQPIEADNRKRIRETQVELQHVQHRSNDVHEALATLTIELEQAQQEAQGQWSNMTIIGGGGLGGTIAAATIGAIAVVPGMCCGLVVAHHQKRISKFLFGENPDPVPAPIPTVANPVAIEFNHFSTGIWGRYFQKRSSFTAGNVCIDIGDGKKVTYAYDLNKENKISYKDLFDLQTRLARNLESGKISAEQCLIVIEQLESISINRGEHHRDTVGLMFADNIYFRDLKRTCTQALGR